ncbi:barstar family protein [Allopusillimonas ginsengisoli]|uniref:barstar family protein n=1 Tax=Allopusillimonas ginsengisoli TaxID=453575 RepID=UPI0039C3380C
MSQAQSLQTKLQKGGLIDVSALTQQQALDAAQAAEMTAFVVNCDRARSRSAVLRAIVKAVDFPEFFGSNLDALYDCLCDTVLDHKNGLFLWFDHLHSGDPALAADSEAILAVCADAADFAANNDSRFAYGVVHAGKHPDPEPSHEPAPSEASSTD